jgi:pyruvate/2-oxoglutarate dehydrogenase complex dihydrolipoamide acyltransferase (E2) component
VICATVFRFADRSIVVENGSEWIQPREFLALTVTMDHHVIDGSPAARFIARLRELIEGAELVGTAGAAR